MSVPHEPLPPSGPPQAAPLDRARRLLGRWWRRQPPARQDRFATLGPLVSVLLFLAAIISAFWYLRNEEIERETEAVKRDAEITQQQLSLRLKQNQDELVRIARELSGHEVDAGAFVRHAIGFTRERPEVARLTWVGVNRALKSSYYGLFYSGDYADPKQPDPSVPSGAAESPAEATFRALRASRQAAYSRVFKDQSGSTVFQLQVPLLEQGAFAGALIADVAVDTLLRNYMPPEVSRRHLISLVDESGRQLASTMPASAAQTRSRSVIVSDVPLTPALNGMQLRS
ncbi:MAG: PAS domain-containing sensor histidine kinase, partial [Rubrivivax sp.]